MQRTQKEEFVSDMCADLEAAAGVLFVDYTGLSVNDTNLVRSKFREAGVGYRVVKNTLMSRVLERTVGDKAASLKGSPTGVVLGYEDPVAAAKLTYDLIDEFKSLEVKGGLLDGESLDANAVEALSKMPSRAELQAGIVGLAMSPGRHLIAQVKSPGGRILGAIESMIELKEE